MTAKLGRGANARIYCGLGPAGDLGSIIRDVVNKYRPNLEPLELVYKDLHRHPELPCQEQRTSQMAAKYLQDLGFSIRKNVGGHGVIGVLKNGRGPTVLVRAEMNALPILEKTDLPYASTVRIVDTDWKEKPVSHACGHDMHVTCLIGTATFFVPPWRNGKEL
jgi:metal-dependent amidase/aminoacylase/carboxypeptidase family protein